MTRRMIDWFFEPQETPFKDWMRTLLSLLILGAIAAVIAYLVCFVPEARANRVVSTKALATAVTKHPEPFFSQCLKQRLVNGIVLTHADFEDCASAFPKITARELAVRKAQLLVLDTR